MAVELVMGADAISGGVGVSVYADGTPARSITPAGGAPIPGAVGGSTVCAGLARSGAACTAKPAHGTELCYGHLRSAGRV